MRPIIRPGIRIVRRDVRTLQVGMDWPGLTVLPDSPALQAVLDAIDGFRDVTAIVLAASATGLPRDECSAAMELLVDVGAVVDRSWATRPDCPESTWSALWLLAGRSATAADVLALRRGCRVRVAGSSPVAEVVRDLLPRAQVRLTDDPAAATLVVLTDLAEPDRRESDRAMRSGLPHVWGYLRDLVGVVGPFVVPGSSACLRCADAARHDLDPAWLTTLTAAVPDEPPGEPVLTTLVGAMVAHEVVAWASGYRPLTYDATVEIPYGAGLVERLVRPPHPQCGCGWLSGHDTMGA